MNLRTATFATVLVAACAPAAASADTVAVAKARALSGPALLPAGVAWAATTSTGAVAVRSGAPGGAPQTLFTSAPPSGRGNTLGAFGLSASASHVVVGIQESYESEGGGGTAYSEAFGGPLGSPFKALAGDHVGDLPAVTVSNLDLSGDALLTVENVTGEALPRLMVQDLAAGTDPQQVGPLGAYRARIAGPFVAYALPSKDVQSKTTTVVVHDRRTGKEAYRVAVPVTPPYAFGFAFDVQEDGTLAVLAANPASTGQRPKGDVAWASVADPALHVVARDVDVAYGVIRIAAGRIAFSRPVGPPQKLTGAPAEPLQRELAVADLAGTVRAASFPLPAVTGADLDATRVAYASGDCVYGADLASPAPVGPPAGPCAQTATSTYTKTVAGQGRVKAAVGCLLAPASGCSGTVTVRRRTASGARGPALATAPLKLAPGRAKSVTLTVGAATRAKLRKGLAKSRRTIYVDVVTTTVDPGGKQRTSYQQASLRVR